MINADTEQTAQTAVQVRPGCQHPTLGAIGGWEGIVLRSFSADGVVYIDVEVSVGTIAGLSRAEKGRYYSSKIVFTRVRLAQRDTQPLPAAGLQSARADIMAQSQHEWFDEVGTQEPDPTRFVADRAAVSRVDVGRREAIRSLVGYGAFILVMLALSRQDCNSGNPGTGSWGRSGGFSS